jgi:hypothetical protein
MAGSMKWFRRAWRGEEKLWRVFWLYSVLVPLTAYLFLIVLPIRIYATPLVTYSYFFVGWAALNCWLIVPMWRCGDNTNWWVWTRLARINVLIMFVEVCTYFYSGGLTDLSGRNRAYGHLQGRT